MIPLNLKTTAGRCAPLALGQNAAIPEFTIPTDVHSGVVYARPPLGDRACCSGDDGESLASPHFPISAGAGPQPVAPDPAWSVGTLNLRSNTGRCDPIALAFPSVPNFQRVEGVTVDVLFTRPPVSDRACCAGDDGDALPTPYFTITSTCRYIALQNESGFFALEDESGYFALECAM